jgi:thiol-disulfide isomerase/thioredoxin
MKVIKRSLIFTLLQIVVLGLVFWTNPVRAQTPAPENPVYIYLFWGDGCPHCAAAKPFLESLPEKYSNVIYQSIEIYNDQDNLQFFSNMAEKYDIEQLGVPTIFVGPHFVQGYSEELDQQIIDVIIQCSQNGCIDAAEGVDRTIASTINRLTNQPSTPTVIIQAATPTPAIAEETQIPTTQTESLLQSQSIDIPFFGKVDLAPKSAAFSTVLIAFVDGFNPCSLWVLSMLIALTLHTGSRKKVFTIGIIFLSVTAIIYALFIAGLFSILKIANYLGWIQAVVAIVALFFALVNIKDYFWYKEGLSFTIAEDKKSGIFKKMRSVVDASGSFWGLVGATIVLAAGVSLVEFSCTAGFPMVWVNLLNAQNISGPIFVLLLLLYMLIYQLDELVIFFSAVVTLKASRLEEKQGRFLKLVGGMLMLTLSIVMLVNPSLMNNLSSSLAIFGLSILATLLVLIIHRLVLPKFGIHIGTEQKKKKSRG